MGLAGTEQLLLLCYAALLLLLAQDPLTCKLLLPQI